MATKGKFPAEMFAAKGKGKPAPGRKMNPFAKNAKAESAKSMPFAKGGKAKDKKC